jgi:hypothetical protein
MLTGKLNAVGWGRDHIVHRALRLAAAMVAGDSHAPGDGGGARLHVEAPEIEGAAVLFDRALSKLTTKSPYKEFQDYPGSLRVLRQFNVLPY